MTLRWRAFEKTTSKLVQNEISRSPALRKEYRLAHTPWWQTRVFSPTFARILLLSIFASISHAGEEKALGFVLTAGLIYAVLLTAYLAEQIAARLFNPEQQSFYRQFPFRNEDAVVSTIGSFWKICCWFALDLVVVYTVFFSGVGKPLALSVALAVGFSLFQAMLILPLALGLLKLFPGWILRVLAVLGVLGLVFNFLSMGQGSEAWNTQLLNYLAVLPFSSMVAAISRGSSIAVWMWLEVIAVIVLVVWQAKLSVRQLERIFDASLVRTANNGPNSLPEFIGESTTDTEEFILDREFLEELDSRRRDRVFNWVDRRFNARESAVLDFFESGRFRWAVSYKWLFLGAMVCELAVLFCDRYFKWDLDLVVLGAIGLALGVFVPIGRPSEIARPPAFSYMPITLLELAGAMRKVQMCKYALYILTVMLLVCLQKSFGPPMDASLFAGYIKGAVILLPTLFFVPWTLAKYTDDALGCRAYWSVLAIAMLESLFGVLFFRAEEWMVALLLFACFTLMAWYGGYWYLQRMAKGRVDFIPKSDSKIKSSQKPLRNQPFNPAAV